VHNNCSRSCFCYLRSWTWREWSPTYWRKSFWGKGWNRGENCSWYRVL